MLYQNSEKAFFKGLSVLCIFLSMMLFVLSLNFKKNKEYWKICMYRIHGDMAEKKIKSYHKKFLHGSIESIIFFAIFPKVNLRQ